MPPISIDLRRDLPKVREEGWISHDGGECPVDDVLIEAETRGGSRYEASAFAFRRGRWIHSGFLPAEDHIIAYRVVKSEQAK
jgi:hypothetical protein